MAKTTIEKFTSDLSGDDINSDSPTVSFGFDGANYEIDLTESERANLADALAPYISAARAAARDHTRSRGTASSGSAPKDVREWARAQKLEVPARGRIPLSVVQAYEEAH
jgi:hypothetical protein